MIRKKTGNRRGKIHRKKRRINCISGHYINVTDHAIIRYQERVKKMNRENAHHSIIQAIKHSRLIALTKFGGREIRENRGVLFVCELQGNCLNVITILKSEVEMRFAC